MKNTAPPLSSKIGRDRRRQMFAIFSGAVAGLLAGLAIGTYSGQRVAGLDLSPEINPSRSANVRSGPMQRSIDGFPLVTRLAQSLSTASGVDRWWLWMEAIEKSGPREFPQLARLARSNRVALEMVGLRWAEIAPRHLFDTASANSSDSGFPSAQLGEILFREWPERDVDGAIQALNESIDFGNREHWRSRTLEVLMTTDVERGIEQMSRWKIRNYEINSERVRRWAAADPGHAAKVAFDHPAGVGTAAILATISHEWSKTDPAGALKFGLQRRGEFGSFLTQTVFKDWTERNLKDAVDWLTVADQSTRNRLSSRLVEAWAETDAPGALAWSISNLSGSSLTPAVATIINEVARNDVSRGAQIVNEMEPSGARAAAAAALFARWIGGTQENTPVPAEAIAWLKTVDAPSLGRAVAETRTAWAEADPKGIAEFLRAANNSHISDEDYRWVASALADRQPEEALRWAAGLSPDRSLDAGGGAFVYWHFSKPELAMKWLNGLPEDDVRREPFLAQTLKVMASESDAAGRLALLPGKNRPAARRVIERLTLPDQVRTRLLQALEAH